MDIEMIRGIPIEEFLSRLGQEPVRRHGDECWYLSPCREERTPSFHVNTRKGVWHDFGTGHGGDIFTLAGELSGKRRLHGAGEVHRRSIWRNSPRICRTEKEKRKVSGQKSAKSLPASRRWFAVPCAVMP